VITLIGVTVTDTKKINNNNMANTRNVTSHRKAKDIQDAYMLKLTDS